MIKAKALAMQQFRKTQLVCKAVAFALACAIGVTGAFAQSDQSNQYAPGLIKILPFNCPPIPVPQGPQPIGVWRYVTNPACGGNTNQMPPDAQFTMTEDGCAVWISTIYADSPALDSSSSRVHPPTKSPLYTGWFGVDAECGHSYRAKAVKDRVVGGYADGTRDHLVSTICPFCHCTNTFSIQWKHPQTKARVLAPEEVPPLVKPPKLKSPKHD